MNPLKRLLVVGGGLALGLVSAGSSAALDKEKMTAKKKPFKGHAACEIKPKYRRIWLWPS
jgi:hypothetical protein